MSDDPNIASTTLQDLQIDRICDDFEENWSDSSLSRVGELLDQVDEVLRDRLFRRLLEVDFEFRQDLGQPHERAFYRDQFPEFAETIQSVVPDDLRRRYQSGDWIGKYRVIEQIGSGSFGVVVRAHDEATGRDVAIKVAHHHVLRSHNNEERFWQEARHAASLDHAGITRVYTVEGDHDPPFIVQQFVDGKNLREVVVSHALDPLHAVRIVKEVADAIAHAHQRGVYHRDLKPTNILIGSDGHARVADFGLALGDNERAGHQGQRAGSPNYMAPEQVCFETPRIDGRTDIWGLGVVLYELVAGKLPFSGPQRSKLFEEIRTKPIQPLVQIKPQIPAELNRVCEKCLAKRMSDRYMSAFELRDDLEHLMLTWPGEAADSGSETAETDAGRRHEQTEKITATTRHRIRPKGLRPFDESDDDFFADLLPGPRDRNMVPETIAFWTRKLDQRDDDAFPAGVIYGPSGAGKSSLIRAGILQRLSDHVIPIYIEASAHDTERRVREGLRRAAPGLSEHLSLAQTVAELRDKDVLRNYAKVVLVLDQFEQWLRVHDDILNEDLYSALRHCDGRNVQVVFSIRDDFWLRLTRLMNELEVPIAEGNNSRAVDRFDLHHAGHVLQRLGQAYDCLPADLEDCSEEQRNFVKTAVGHLAHQNRVIPVHLVLFAEMLKHKEWTPATLTRIGAIEALGVDYLDLVLESHSATLEHRPFLKDMVGVLTCLLPDVGTDLKGNALSETQLRERLPESQPEHIAQALEILDHDLHFICPTVADGAPSGRQHENSSGVASYQLTHDFLVAPMRDWINRKERATWQGRARLKLAEMAGEWRRNRSARHLPTISEYVHLAAGTWQRKWTTDQTSMMRAAGRKAARTLIMVLLLVVAIGWAAGLIRRNMVRPTVAIQVDQLMTTDSAAVLPLTVELLDRNRSLAIAQLRPIEKWPKERRYRAAVAIAQLGGELDLEEVVNGVQFAQKGECEWILAPCRNQANAAIATLERQLTRAPDAHLRARLAIMLTDLGKTVPLVEMLKHQGDTSARTEVIHSVADWHGDLARFTELLRDPDQDPLVRSGVCKALGRIGDANTVARNVVRRIFESATDTGEHSASGWALQQWRVPLPPPDKKQSVPTQPKKTWFRIPHTNLTMLRIGKGKLHYAVDIDGKNEKEIVEVTKPFYIADREVPRELFEEFAKANPKIKWRIFREESPTGEHPAQGVNVEDACQFCNWLSGRHNRRAYYQRTPEGNWETVAGSDGFRLPRHNEFKYAARANATTFLPIGPRSLRVRLVEYECFTKNSSRGESERTMPCGTLLPNDLGLFDCFGNVSEWCHDGEKFVPFGGAFYKKWDHLLKSPPQSADRRSRWNGLRVVLDAE